MNQCSIVVKMNELYLHISPWMHQKNIQLIEKSNLQRKYTVDTHFETISNNFKNLLYTSLLLWVQV